MDFRFFVSGGSPVIASDDDNIDIEIHLADGTRHAATFFTVQNLRTLLAGYRSTGECAGGLYVWASDMIVVESISEQVIQDTLADLLSRGEFHRCCTRLSDDRDLA